MSDEAKGAWSAYLDELDSWLDASIGVGTEEHPELSDPPVMPADVDIATEDVPRSMELIQRFHMRVLELEELRDATGRQLSRVKDLPALSDPISGQARYLDQSA